MLRDILYLLGFATFAGLLAVRLRRRRRPELDDRCEPCPTCGYDVRGLSRCPECGSPASGERREKLGRLRFEWPAVRVVPRIPAEAEHTVNLLTTDNGVAVELLRQHLLARGIPAELDEEPRERKVTLYHLSVWSADRENALRVIDRLWPG